MKVKAIVCAIMALSLCSAGVSFAQGNGEPNQRDQKDQGQRGAQQNRRDQQARQPQQQQRNQQTRANTNARQDERGAGPDHAFRRGQRLPVEYRSRQYVVDDWRGHHLSAPPRGYHWVQTGGDYVLVAIATGVILQLLLNQ
jgi:Ni/Co efflux regulator RcnB